eukprot:1898645-Pleurochrysis_carterae.AAC.1
MDEKVMMVVVVARSPAQRVGDTLVCARKLAGGRQLRRGGGCATGGDGGGGATEGGLPASVV